MAASKKSTQDQEFSSMAFYEWELEQYGQEDQILSEAISPRQSKNPDYSYRLDEIIRLFTVAKADHISREFQINIELDTQQALDALEVIAAKKASPRTSVISLFKPGHKKSPSQPLTKIDEMELTIAKEIIGHARAYILGQKNVDGYLSALSNLTRNSKEVVIHLLPGSGALKDEQMSLPVVIQNMKKGSDISDAWKNLLANKATIKDKSVLDSLKAFSNKLADLESDIKPFIEGARLQADFILANNVDKITAELSLDDAREVTKQSKNSKNIIARLTALITVITPSEYGKLLSALKKDFKNYVTPDQPKPEEEKPNHRRRNAWG